MTPSPQRKSDTEFDHNTSWQYEEVGELYDARRFQSRTGQRFHNAETAAIHALLDKAEETGKITTAIDLPCGTGRISQISTDRGYDLVCADISLPMLKAARRKIEDRHQQAVYTAANIYRLPFPDDAFDSVSCIRLFQHLDSKDSIRALRELGRISSRFVIVNFMYASGYYKAMRILRQKTGRYAPRYAVTRTFLNRIEPETGLRLHASQMPQPLHSGNMVILFDSTRC